MKAQSKKNLPQKEAFCKNNQTPALGINQALTEKIAKLNEMLADSGLRLSTAHLQLAESNSLLVNNLEVSLKLEKELKKLKKELDKKKKENERISRTKDKISFPGECNNCNYKKTCSFYSESSQANEFLICPKVPVEKDYIRYDFLQEQAVNLGTYILN